MISKAYVTKSVWRQLETELQSVDAMQANWTYGVVDNRNAIRIFKWWLLVK